MKKIDKLVLSSFFGPFFITFFVVVFILLTQFMLKYFDEIVGKDLGVGVISQLIFYFSINMTTNALPLALLLSSLMTFGNLGEHFELTAIKGAGISLLRTMRPMFLVACFLVVLGFFNNNYIVPQANLEAFSLLYDIRQKKPALDIKQGVFYHGIPGYSIKINQKFSDDETLKDIIIYDHAGTRGNKAIILADSGKMYNIMDSRYLVLELFEGKRYEEQTPQRNSRRKKDAAEEASPYLRSQFDKSKMIFSLSEFDLKRTRKDLFSNNRLMKNLNQLRSDLDSMHRDYNNMSEEIRMNSSYFFKYHQKSTNDMSSQPEKPGTKKVRPEERENKQRPRVQQVSHDADTGNRQKLRSIPISQEATKPSERASVPRTLRRKADEIDQINVKATKRTSKVPAKLPANNTINTVEAADTVSSDSLLINVHIVDFYQIGDSTNVVESYLPYDSLMARDTIAPLTGYEKIDSVFSTEKVRKSAVLSALNHVRYVKSNLSTQNIQMSGMIRQIRMFEIEKFKKLAMAITILAFFLIGAPLGAIIKRGGLGMPVLLSILFFVLFYVISMLGEKWARQGLMSPLLAVWLANIILIPIGLFALKQARKDAKLFDLDYYNVLWKRIRKRFKPVEE